MTQPEEILRQLTSLRSATNRAISPRWTAKLLLIITWFYELSSLRGAVVAACEVLSLRDIISAHQQPVLLKCVPFLNPATPRNCSGYQTED